MLLRLIALLASSVALVEGAPTTAQVETPVPPEDFANLVLHGHFAAAAYCDPSLLKNWTCGQACDAIPGFQPTISGGNGNSVQIYFVGYWPEKDTIVVSHEGTDPTKLLSVLTDVNIIKFPLDARLFPGVPPTVLVHDGFRRAQASTAAPILAEVRRLISLYNTNNITVIGHSLGGAIAELDVLFFALNIPNAKIKGITYGTPRVGNTAFAQLIDEVVPDFTRMNNKKDLVPIVPGRFAGFYHPAREIHIVSSRIAVICSGDDNAVDPDCSDRQVPTIADGSVLDHLGPYGGVYMGPIFCDG